MKVDQDKIITLEDDTVNPAAKSRDNAGGAASVIVLSDSDSSEETEVRSKLCAESVRSAAVGGDSRKEEEEKGKGQSLLYLTRVRGIGAQYNHSNVAIGIKGKLKLFPDWLSCRNYVLCLDILSSSIGDLVASVQVYTCTYTCTMYVNFYCGIMHCVYQ